MELRTLHKLSYGMYVISAKLGEELNGQIANTVFQITSEPPTVAVSINKQNLTHEYIKGSGAFSVSILSEEAPMTFIGLFGFKSGRDVAKFKEETTYQLGEKGVPIVLDYTIGFLEAEVIQEVDAGTHTIFIGKIYNAQVLSEDEPMTYAYYHKVKKGLAPKTAPTYLKPEDRPVLAPKAEQYKCLICGYIYDSKTGDPDSGVEPNTLFAELPAAWACPICSAGKEQFLREN